VFGDGGQDLRAAFLGRVVETLWGKLTTAGIEPDRLGKVVGSLLREHHLMMTTNVAAEAEVFHRLGADSAVPALDGDFLSVVSLNRGANKIDYFLRREIDYRTTLGADGTIDATVTVKLHNDAPATGLPAYIIGGNSFAESAYGTNLQYLSVYSPWDLVSVTTGGADTPAEPDTEFGRKVYTALVSIGPGQTQELVFTLHGTWTTGAYRLRVMRQSTVTPDQLSIGLTLPADWSQVAGPTLSAGSEHTLQQSLLTDLLFELGPTTNGARPVASGQSVPP
jgi:hypothetical protein